MNANQSDLHLRLALVKVSQRLVDLGLNRGTSGNCSILSKQEAGCFMVTPSAVAAIDLEPNSIVLMSLNGQVRGQGRPSSEWRLHRDIYINSPDIGAVIHVHSPYATALSCLRIEVPSFHYMVAVAGSDSIRCADYATFGGQELSDQIALALQGRRACLMANHGMLATGKDIGEALDLAVEVESLCQQYILALSVGTPALLSKQEMNDVLSKFAHYRRPLP